MSLRELVTGNDACTPDDGAGPSNAFAGLANTLLGTSSKQQERLSELPGLQGLPGSSEARFVPQRPEDAAYAAINGEQVPMPGLFQGSSRDVEEFMRRAPDSRAGPSSQWHSEFQQLMGPAARQQPDARMPTAGPLAPFLHAFFDSAKAHTQFQPLPSPKIPLSVEDQCHIRDRSTILARHVFADGGDSYADEQVDRLLQSLHIDPRALPSHAGGAEWEQIFQRGQIRADGPGVQDAVLQSHFRNGARPDVDRWADQFSDLKLDGPAENQMVADFLQEQGREGTANWADQFSAEPASDWANEFRQSQAATQGSQREAGDSREAMEQTRILRDALAESADPKLRNSKFLQFLSKMSRGEIILEDNQAKAAPSSRVGNQWAEEHVNENREAQFEDAWQNFHQADGGRPTWADQFQEEIHPPNEWVEQYGAERVAENWASTFDQQRTAQNLTSSSGDQEYRFSPNNPFLADLNSFAKGKELFRNGLLSEAVLAFEAEVQRNASNVEAWRLLGTVHAENDDDQRAILALGKALQASPGDAEALLSLGVSYTNELDRARALTNLMEWLKGQPGHAGVASVQLPQDARERLRAVVKVFRTAAQMDAGAADVHVALGVLYNLSRDFDNAVGAFRTALQTRTTDYSLWNKLGATLANSSRSGEAISAYQRALDLKPNYMRAWTNMGISQANVGEYEQSARFYVRALGLNPHAANVWGYLRTSLSCANRNDLLQAVEEENLPELAAALPL